MIDVYTPIGKLFPKRIRLKIRKEIVYSTINVEPDRFLGFALVVGFSIAYILASLLKHYNILPMHIGFALSFAMTELVLYLWITLSSDGKAKFVEEALPDALQLMSSNIRAGLTTDKALLMAARPEFGPLEYEIRRIGKETMAGRSLAQALLATRERIKSKNLDRTLELIVQSLKSGGKLGDLLDQTANDLRDQQIIQKEVSASVLMYVFFILIAIGLGAPALFSMSAFLVNLLETNMNMITKDMPNMASVSAALPISITSVSISQGFIKRYAVISLTASSFFGSIVIGLVLKGEERQGLKYFPALWVLSVGLFFLGGLILQKTLGGMLML